MWWKIFTFPARIPSPRSVPSRDKRMLLEMWNLLGIQENVFARFSINSIITNTYEFFDRENSSFRKSVNSALTGTGTRVAREVERTGGAIPMPTFARMPPTTSSLFPVDIPQSSVVGQQRQQISELQFDKFPTTSTFLCWKIRSKNQVAARSDFPSKAMPWINEVKMVDSVEELKSSRSIFGKNHPIRKAGCEDFVCFEQDHPVFSLQEEGQSRGTESPKKRMGLTEEDRSPS